MRWSPYLAAKEILRAMEAISLKGLALFLGPIVVLNTRSYFDNLLLALERCIAERFMDPRHDPYGRW